MFMAILQLCDILPCVTLIPDGDYAEIVTEVKNKIKLKPILLVLFPPPHNCNILEKYRSGCCGLILILVYLFSKPVCIFETSSVFFFKVLWNLYITKSQGIDIVLILLFPT